MKIKIPVTFVIETESYDEDGTDNVPPEQIPNLRRVFIENLNYLLQDMDFIQDTIQERLPNLVCLSSIRVEKE